MTAGAETSPSPSHIPVPEIARKMEAEVVEGAGPVGVGEGEESHQRAMSVVTDDPSDTNFF